MSSALSFVPRKLAAKSADARGPQLKSDPPPPPTARHDEDLKRKQNANERISKHTDIDYARLISLALSDYAVSSDSALKSVFHPTLSYIPLVEIFKRFSRYGVKYPTRSLTTGIVKALRTNADEIIDIRLTTSGSGGYELRPRGQMKECVVDSPQDWNSTTAYVERIPPQYRSVRGVLAFLAGLLEDNPASSVHPWARVQGISLPPHHRDQPDDPPTFKDFCLVTMASSNDVKVLASQWPWIRKAGRTPSMEGDAEIKKDATLFGFRVLPKADWTHLRQQYLDHRAKLITEINEYTSVEERRAPGKRPHDLEPVLLANSQPEAMTALTLTLDAPYPYGCLVFVRNVHPQTNKTTLRTLLSLRACNNEEYGQELDYIDYSKGMDTCHLRFSTPSCADLIIRCLEKEQIVQAHGLDDRGTQAKTSVSGKPITAEKVTGRKEEVYWERVPEKIRVQAVQKAIALLDGKGSPNGDLASRKKRRKG